MFVILNQVCNAYFFGSKTSVVKKNLALSATLIPNLPNQIRLTLNLSSIIRMFGSTIIICLTKKENLLGKIFIWAKKFSIGLQKIKYF